MWLILCKRILLSREGLRCSTTRRQYYSETGADQTYLSRKSFNGWARITERFLSDRITSLTREPSMIVSFKLPLTFDPGLLQADLEGIAPSEWVNHFNQKYFEGEWSGVALRSIGGDPRLLYLELDCGEAPIASAGLSDSNCGSSGVDS